MIENKTSQGIGRRQFLSAAGGVALAAIAVGATVPAFAAESEVKTTSTTLTSTSGNTELAEEVAFKCTPSVGTVTALVNTQMSQGVATGSCVVISSDGYIITNYHVIEGSSQVSVSLDDVDYDAEITASDPTSDISVLKIDPGANEIIPMDIGSSSDLKVGQWVMTIGSPLGLSDSVSQGIVSAIGRCEYYDIDSSTRAYYYLIQVDAMINSGSSGGALVNENGELVGITTINYSESGSFAGMGAAIPSDYAMRVANELIQTGTYAHPFLGVGLSDVTPSNFANAGSSSYFGAYVASVEAGTPAEDAGIKTGDVITGVDGKNVSSSVDVIVAVRMHQVGDEVVLTIDRNGSEEDVRVRLTSDQAATGSSTGSQSGQDAPADDGSDSGFSFFGNGDQDTDQGTDQGSDGSGDSNGNQGSDGGSWGWGFGNGNGGSYGYWNNPYGGGSYGNYPGDSGPGFGYGDYGYGDYGYGYGDYGYGDYGNVGQGGSSTITF